MATYAIGDVQGCFDELQALLERVGFDRQHDRLWFVGDLVNRGPKSLEVLRFVMELGERAVTVLGNHDLHLITQHEGFERRRKDDTFTDVLGAHQRQLARQGVPNALLGTREIDRLCATDKEGDQLLRHALARLLLSARAYHRVLRVARSIADLAGEAAIKAAHIAEAIQYRRLDASF